MATSEPSGHNIGELMRQGVVLTTREVLAILHEVCRDAAAAFPRSVDALWITDTGEVLIARSDQLAAALDPRAGVASLLEAMLPRDGADDADHHVPSSLRGLPSRLRAATDAIGPQDRRDLMAILSWHLGADPRQVVQQLVARVSRPDAMVVPPVEDPWDFPAVDQTPAAVADSPVSTPPQRRRARAATTFALIGLAVLFIGVGSASYWLFGPRQASIEAVATSAPEVPADVPAEVPAEVATVTAPPAAPAPESPTSSSTPPTTPGESPRPLALEVRDGAFSPAFGATGRELFFHAGRASGRLLVAALDDFGEVSRISAVPSDGARDYHPRISPDGRLIAFDSDRDGDRGVYVVDRDGSNIQRVSGPGYAAVPSWSPDMKWLAFIRGEPSRPRVWNLWLRDLTTGALQRHTSFRSGQVWGASWFPDGSTVAYSHDDKLIISHLDAREDIVIESPQRGRLVRTPAVSPDGKSVVFQVFRDGVWVFDVSSRTTRRILADPSAEEFAWSPDGQRIAYHSRRDGAWKIWVMAVDD